MRRLVWVPLAICLAGLVCPPAPAVEPEPLLKVLAENPTPDIRPRTITSITQLVGSAAQKDGADESSLANWLASTAKATDHGGLAPDGLGHADRMPHDVIGDHRAEAVVVLTVECVDALADDLSVRVFGHR